MQNSSIDTKVFHIIIGSYCTYTYPQRGSFTGSLCGANVLIVLLSKANRNDQLQANVEKQKNPAYQITNPQFLFFNIYGICLFIESFSKA